MLLSKHGRFLGFLRSRVSVILFALPLAACAPFPHSITLSPPIEGVVLSSGAARNATHVYLSAPRGMPCTEKSETFQITDPQGRFQFDSTHELRWIYAPMVAPLSVSFYTLCVADGSSAMAYRGLVFPYGKNPPVKLTCDLGRPRKLRLPDMSELEVVCEQISMQ